MICNFLEVKRDITTFNLDDLPDLEDVDISECGDFSADNSLVSYGDIIDLCFIQPL